MALYRYFKLADDILPSPTGDLSPVCLPGDNKGAWLINTKIKTAKISSGGETGFFAKIGPAKISYYTVCKNAVKPVCNGHNGTTIM